MAEPFETELINRHTGMRLRVLESPQTTQSRDLVWEATYRPRSPRPPAHFHPVQEEHFEVLAGTMMVRIGGQEARELRTGETLKIAPGTEHSMWNASTGETRMLWRTSPALETYRMFRKLFALAEQGTGQSGKLQMAVVLHRYRKEMRIASRAGWRQRLLIALLAPLGRVLGYRAD